MYAKAHIVNIYTNKTCGKEICITKSLNPTSVIL